AAAAQRRSSAEGASASQSEVLKALRSRIGVLAAELDKVVNTAHGSEMARAEHRLRLEQFEQHAAEEYGIEPDVLVAEYGPDVPIPMPEEPAEAKQRKRRKTGAAEGAGPDSDADSDSAGEPMSIADALRAVTEAARAEDAPAEGQDDDSAGGPVADEPSVVMITIPYVREEQHRRAEEAERQLARLGKVNPLALEEYAALQERHQFLATQLEDLRKTRRDLLMVVKEVDDRVQEVFASAYADTAREFEGLFARLFPDGSGRLMLTEPEDMLTTGIEIEARPPGKKVKRLSLLSGGERSLTAIAYLFAIFKARPSPFYVLDEVEAALDDSNLQRLLRVFDEVRETSQLIIITHQRRTMEAADALYGVSMRGDGVSTVISQRIREHETV
ncbi:MAG: AAA family ATPase, partial [Trebonia sp.]